jgi:hypothetical protein
VLIAPSRFEKVASKESFGDPGPLDVSLLLAHEIVFQCVPVAQRSDHCFFSSSARLWSDRRQIIENSNLVEHWDVIQDEATRRSSKSGLPMFGETFALAAGA